MTDDIRPVKAIQLTHTEDHYIPIAVGTWRRREGNVVIRQVVQKHAFRLWHDGLPVEWYDTLAEAQEAGLRL